MKPKGSITFIHHKTGTHYTFNYEKNDLNGAMMYWFDPMNSMYAGKMHDIKTIIKNIRSKCKIINEKHSKKI